MAFRSDWDKKNAISAETVTAVCQFRDVRQWRRFHEPKDLAMSIAIEAAELLECYQWTGEKTALGPDSTEAEHVADELADVLIYAILFADRAGISLDEAIRRKLAKNLRKYPTPETTSVDEPEEKASEKGEGVRVSTHSDSIEDEVLGISRHEIEAFLRLTEAGPLGEWKSDPDGRFAYVAYQSDVMAFWSRLARVPLTDDVSPDAMTELLHTTPETQTAEALVELLAKLVRLERMRDGMFLTFQARGFLGRVLRTLLARFDERATAKR